MSVELFHPPARVIVEGACEDPVAETVRHAVLGDVGRGGDAVGAAREQDFRPSDSTVILPHLDVWPLPSHDGARQAHGRRRAVDRVPWHRGQDDTHLHAGLPSC
ncbi:hypothetical protein HII36_32485 [Nonomuraea sp. NN258]|uniref:hypothetical protein n=1 Tax=Nonomuraea antri TaxID=2730852 RepID=UPI0015698D53|nr:hypothetical protein [Nonomuraea antri]NRQ36516.1 hypothetical protein [Nonomuraea antri]